MLSHTLFASILTTLAIAQTPGTVPEVHPKFTTWTCTRADGCKSQNTALVLDSVFHHTHQRNDTTKGCGDWGSPPDPAICPDEKTCAQNCIMEGIQNYTDHGITVTPAGDSVVINMFKPDGTIAAPRIYLLAEDEENYESLQLLNQEIAFDVDVSNLPCGMDGSFYLSEMEASGGRSLLNPGAAVYGTGYCDAQCFVTPFVDGVVRLSFSKILVLIMVPLI